MVDVDLSLYSFPQQPRPNICRFQGFNIIMNGLKKDVRTFYLVSCLNNNKTSLVKDVRFFDQI